MISSLLSAVTVLASAAPQGEVAREFVKFPPGFQWCVSTAAHQIEGGNRDSDWWQWEQKAGKIRNGERSGAACDHWNRVDEDISLLRDLGVQTYRFSIEWARIEPREGVTDWDAVAHYQREVALLRQSGIEPMVTLQHFTLPQWVAERGGWEWEGTPEAFGRYAALVYQAVGPNVEKWLTLNEPMVMLTLGYIAGINPPQKKMDGKAAARAIVGMLKSHSAAYHALHEEARRAGRPVSVGVAHHLRIFEPAYRRDPLDRWAARASEASFNWAFPVALETGRIRIKMPFVLSVDQTIPGLAGTQDYIGLNYYSRDLVHVQPVPVALKMLVTQGAPTTDVGWEIYPEGLLRLLRALAARFHGKSIYITENGIADSQDRQRIPFIKSHLAMVRRAIDEGIPVTGYCHWSLMDNFEWSSGFAPRFGLYEVDYETQRRTPRPSARLFSEITRSNGFWID